MNSDKFIVKDSGKREEYKSGMVRDTDDGKINFSLVLDGPLIERLATHLTKASKKYGKGNWLLADGTEELNRFKESAFRHFVQWFKNHDDEDHFSACVFNLNAYEYLKEKLNKKS